MSHQYWLSWLLCGLKMQKCVGVEWIDSIPMQMELTNPEIGINHSVPNAVMGLSIKQWINVFQWIQEKKSTCLRNYIMSFWTIWRTFSNISERFWWTKLARTVKGGCLFAANQTQFHANPKEADRDSRTERSSPYRYFSISGNYILNWGGDEFNHRDHNWIL